MEVLKIIVMPVFSVLVLFLLTRFMGYREVSQLSMFDYVTGISIGSIAAEMATGIENFQKPLIAMIIYAFCAISISFFTNKSLKLRKKIMGKPIVLIDNGIIFYDKMKKAKLDISELQMELRAKGFFNITKVKTAVLEINGKLSVIPFSTKDESEELCVNIIMDGELLEENIKSRNINREFIKRKMLEKGIYDIKDIFLAVYIGNEISFFKKEFSGNKNYGF